MEEFQTPLQPIILLDLAILSLLIATAFAMMRVRRLFAVVMLSGIFSFLAALFFVSLDAVDVAFTEAAVGAGISTVLMLSGMLLTARREKPAVPGYRNVAMVVCLVTGAALFYATIDMPAFGDPNAPANAYIGQQFVERTPQDVEIPNIVTAILASYRGFDTLGEVLVVFAAGVGVIMLLGAGSLRGGRKVKDERPEDDSNEGREF
ncbi:DUF4040 domain-containing protein [Aquisalinus flavus]|uniref:Cation:proton antiporter n=1 Tax=Aquisalinus flavus TaxID=1526572 RepID=A0A8J2V1M6_9PROT|nr:DUF4040 domain-containing protein [Aquisalinus flavus]MBD0426263.1 DUF4040 domain-containing protein [Aquisalinus flavus]UNE48166.1 DUF4040 domain-containing protein [Aquisalinus flavus]GGD09336.1 cation:proton antiporter [Aquisalinus flavus]